VAFGQSDAPKGKEAAEEAALPARVLAVLDQAAIWQRHSGDTDRAVIQLPGLTGFLAGPESSAAAVQTLWPELDEDQVEMAVRRLARNIKNHFRQQDKTLISWCNRW
jgi:hypothetical protein